MIKLIKRIGQGQSWRAMARPTLTLVIIMLVAAVLEAPFVHRAGPRTIPIGGADLGLARNWGYKEWSESWPGSHGPITSLYRWLGARSELLFTPVAPRQPQLLSLSLIGGRPDQTVVAPVVIHAQKQAVNAFGVAPVLRHYRLLIPCWWSRTRSGRTIPQWLGLGMLAGLMCMVYWINAILLVLPAMDLLIAGLRAPSKRDWRQVRGLLAKGALFCFTLVLAFSPQMIVWQILYATPLTVPQGAGFAGPSEFEALALLVSPLHGTLLWAPITVIGVLGLDWYVGRRGLEGCAVALAFCLYFLYNAMLFDWHGSGTLALVGWQICGRCLCLD